MILGDVSCSDSLQRRAKAIGGAHLFLSFVLSLNSMPENYLSLLLLSQPSASSQFALLFSSAPWRAAAFESESHVAGLTSNSFCSKAQLKLALNSQSCYLYLLSAMMAGMCHGAWLRLKNSGPRLCSPPSSLLVFLFR